MREIKTLAKELQDYTRVVGSHNKHIQSVANRLVEITEQPQLNENQQIKTNNNLLKINDLAFELQHGTVLTNEQWEKVEKIYKLSLMGDEEAE
ncbi:hypothetical protein [Enterococcus casseliflavus]|uniref:hypothetical protein n=1 Tax=Enterococcus casseliflavus TaxID=37734 RepID=UPI0018AA6959|nr:hypothetical protein [Enterococcus casseliflavus]